MIQRSYYSVCADFPCVWQWVGDNAPAIIAFGSLCVAMMSFWLTRDAARQTRRHNEISVRPALQFVYQIEGKPAGARPYGGTITHMLKNQGLGPAKVARYQMFLDSIEQERDMRAIGSALAPVMGVPPQQVTDVNVHVPSVMAWLAKDGSFELLRVTFNVADEEGFLTMERRLRSRVRYVVEYESPYGEKKTMDSKEIFASYD